MAPVTFCGIYLTASIRQTTNGFDMTLRPRVSLRVETTANEAEWYRNPDGLFSRYSVQDAARADEDGDASSASHHEQKRRVRAKFEFE